jgi:hypothetical protein
MKVTLITSPDIFENSNPSIGLFNLSEEQQNEASAWLSEKSSDLHINVYFYQNENDINWFFYALNSSHAVFVNLDNLFGITKHLASYIISKQDVFYSCSDINLSELYSHINQNKLNIKDFLERVLGERFF